MKASSLRIVAGSNTLLRNHLLSVQSEFEQCDAKANAGHLRLQHTLPILALLKDIGDHRKMVIRVEQVQRAQINKYWQSIHTGRKATRGEHVPTDMITDVMIKIALRFIVDLKNTLPELTQPLIAHIHTKLHDLHDRMSMYQMFIDSGCCEIYQNDCDTSCQCNSYGISCRACHQGAHDQCQHHCTE